MPRRNRSGRYTGAIITAPWNHVVLFNFNILIEVKTMTESSSPTTIITTAEELAVINTQLSKISPYLTRLRFVFAQRLGTDSKITKSIDQTAVALSVTQILFDMSDFPVWSMDSDDDDHCDQCDNCATCNNLEGSE